MELRKPKPGVFRSAAPAIFQAPTSCCSSGSSRQFKYIISMSHRLGQVILNMTQELVQLTVSLRKRVFWGTPVTSLFFTPEFQNSNALLAQE